MLTPGDQFSHYKVVSVIGSGGMGAVYLAHDSRLDRQVALKVLLPDVAADQDRLNRFTQEARSASALNHPNILTVFETGSVGDIRYIATEFVKGHTLRDRPFGPSPTLDQILDVGIQVSAALSAAHEAGIVHRDIKPENVIVRDDGLVKVLDFGLAKLSEKQNEPSSSESATRALVNTQPGMVMGTALYMSPEQARARPVDGRSDIWSFGVVLFEMLTGGRPFSGEDQMDVISSIIKDPAPLLREKVPDMPRQLERIIDRTLRKDPNDRYQHIRDLQIDLTDLRDELRFEAKLGRSLEVAVPVSAVNTEAHKRHSTLHTAAQLVTDRRFTLVHLALLALIPAVLIGGLWWYRGGRPTTGLVTNARQTEFENWISAPGELFSNASYSPDSKLVAFSSTRSGKKNIWVKQSGSASAEAIRVTNDSFISRDPIWSPRGDEIAFFSETRNSPEAPSFSAIWRVSALGGTPRLVMRSDDGGIELRRWTDSGQIYYQSKGELWAVDPNSGTTRQVTEFAAEGSKPAWINISYDDREIAYSLLEETRSRIYVREAGSKDGKAVVENASEISSVAWLPEKRRFYFSAVSNGIAQVYAAEAGSGRTDQLTSSETDAIVVDASRDGRSILFSSVKEESNLAAVPIIQGREIAMTRSVNSELWPAVSPNGSAIAFQSIKNLSRGNNLFTGSILVRPVKAAGEDERSLTVVENGYLPAWSPDGSAIAFLRRSGDSAELMAASASGGTERRLSYGGIAPAGYSISPYNTVQMSIFHWAPDGSSIAYVSDRSGAANVWIVSADGASDVQLTANTDPATAIYCPIWSPDGKRIAFFSQAGGASGTAERKLSIYDLGSRTTEAGYSTEKYLRLLGWVDNTSLAAAETDKFGGLASTASVLRVGLDGTKKVLAELNNVYFYNIVLSPDKRQIAFAGRNGDLDDIWIATPNGSSRRLTNNTDPALFYSRLCWAPDGSSIYFGRQTRFSLLSVIDTEE